MIPSSSSSSTLSPLAPPFTVDRPSNAHRLQPFRYPPPSPVAEFNGNGSFDVKESSPVRSDGESSSWIDPSLPYNVSAFSRGGAAERFMAYGDTYGAWHGKHVDSSARQVHIGEDSSAWRGEHPAIYEEKTRGSCNNGLSYFQLSNPNLAMDEYDTSNSNSYDKYMSQLVSCSTDPVVYYPATTCSSSAEEFTPSSEASSSMYLPRNCYSTTQHGNLLYNVDDNYVDYMLGNSKEPSISQYSDGKKGYMKESVADNNMKGNNGTGNFSTATSCSSLENEVTTGGSMDYSTEVKYGIRPKQLNFTDSIASSSRPNSSMRTSSDMLDQPNLAVDSPCWKGASMSRPYSFGGGEMIDHHHEVKESNGPDDLDRGQKYLPVSGQHLITSPYQEKDGGLVYHGSMGCSSLPFLGNFSPDISLYGTDKRFHTVNAKGLESAEFGNFSCVLSEKNNEVRDSEKDSELMNINVKLLGQVRPAIMSADSPTLEGEGACAEAGLTDATQNKSSDLNLDAENYVRNFSVPRAGLDQVAKPVDSIDPTSKCLTSGKDMRLIVKAMHGLSEVLLSSYCNGGVEWKECDHELVQQVIDNLETVTARNKKGIRKSSSHVLGNGQGQSQVSVSKSNDTLKKKSNRSTANTQGKFHCIGSCANSETFDLRRFNGTAQVSVKDLESDVFGKKEENPQAGLYKNLWMQTEAALCSMKYELQLARMKLEMEKYECQTKVNEPVQVIKSPRLNSMHTTVFTTSQTVCNEASCPVMKDAGKSSEAKPKEQKTKKDDKVEGSVMARLEVLKGRYARSNNNSVEEQPNCSDTENTLKGLQSRLADLGFVESGIPQPFDEDGNRDAHPPSPLKGNNKPTDMRHLVSNYNEENYLQRQEISEHAFGGVFHGRTADGSLLQPFSPSVGSQRNPMRFILG